MWRLPLHQPYRSLLKSKFANQANCSRTGYGGAITAGLFLEAFVLGDTPWVHVDMMAYNTSSKPAYPEGGEAMGARATWTWLHSLFN